MFSNYFTKFKGLPDLVRQVKKPRMDVEPNRVLRFEAASTKILVLTILDPREIPMGKRLQKAVGVLKKGGIRLIVAGYLFLLTGYGLVQVFAPFDLPSAEPLLFSKYSGDINIVALESPPPDPEPVCIIGDDEFAFEAFEKQGKGNSGSGQECCSNSQCPGIERGVTASETIDGFMVFNDDNTGLVLKPETLAAIELAKPTVIDKMDKKVTKDCRELLGKSFCEGRVIGETTFTTNVMGMPDQSICGTFDPLPELNFNQVNTSVDLVPLTPEQRAEERTGTLEENTTATEAEVGSRSEAEQAFIESCEEETGCLAVDTPNDIGGSVYSGEQTEEFVHSGDEIYFRATTPIRGPAWSCVFEDFEKEFKVEVEVVGNGKGICCQPQKD